MACFCKFRKFKMDLPIGGKQTDLVNKTWKKKAFYPNILCSVKTQTVLIALPGFQKQL